MMTKLGVVLLGAVAAWAGLRWFEKANLYIPDRQLTILPATFGLAYENVDFTAEDGVRLHAWFVPASTAPATEGYPEEVPPPRPWGRPRGRPRTLVMFHGNGGNISHRVDKLRIFHGLGLSVFMFDYRGYGRSGGSPSEQGTYLDGAAAVRWLKEDKGLEEGALVYYGESLGCAVAMETALQHPPAAFIFDSGFTSVLEMAKAIYPWLPAKYFLRARYDNLAKAPQLKTPLLVAHSPEDQIIPFAMGRRLFEAAPQPKEFFQLRGGHNDGFLETPGYAQAFAEFLKKHAP